MDRAETEQTVDLLRDAASILNEAYHRLDGQPEQAETHRLTMETLGLAVTLRRGLRSEARRG
jgi:hypothetical protein